MYVLKDYSERKLYETDSSLILFFPCYSAFMRGVYDCFLSKGIRCTYY